MLVRRLMRLSNLDVEFEPASGGKVGCLPERVEGLALPLVRARDVLSVSTLPLGPMVVEKLRRSLDAR